MSKTNTAYKEGLKAVCDMVFPARAVLTQKRYMYAPCFLRKPAGTKTAEFVACLHKINAYPLKFPAIGETEPVALLDNKLLDILEYRIPNTWQHTMILHNFDLLEHSVAEFMYHSVNTWNKSRIRKELCQVTKSILKCSPDRLDAKANASRKKQQTKNEILARSTACFTWRR